MEHNGNMQQNGFMAPRDCLNGNSFYLEQSSINSELIAATGRLI